MSGFTDAIAEDVLDHFTGNATWTAPAHLWVALFIGDPDGAGSECSGTSYGRVEASFGAASSAAAANDAEVDFGTAGGAWGTITHFALYTAETAGTLLASGELTASAAITTGEAVSFAVGDLTLTLE